MDTLELRVEPAHFATGAEWQVVPHVNGRSLLERRAAPRTTKAGPNRHPGAPPVLGDLHAGIPCPAPELAALKPTREPHDAAVLGCACGEVGCWPVTATVRADRATVTWELEDRTFTFARAAYERTLRVAIGAAAGR